MNKKENSKNKFKNNASKKYIYPKDSTTIKKRIKNKRKLKEIKYPKNSKSKSKSKKKKNKIIKTKKQNLYLIKK